MLLAGALLLLLNACASMPNDWNLGGLWEKEQPVPQPVAKPAETDPFLQGLSEGELARSSEEAWRRYGHDWHTISQRSRYVRQALVEALDEIGAPRELQFVPIVESGYDPYAYSSVGATGLWQLMPVTARDLHLSDTHELDGRRDIRLSTQAAARFLMKQHRRFGNWPLAFAAYHLGPTAVQRRINKHPWQPADGLRRLPLPPITKTYIRHILGLMVRHKAGQLNFPAPYETCTLKVQAPLDLEALQARAGLRKNELYRLNPKLELRQYFRPSRPLTLRVTTASAKRLHSLLASANAKELQVRADKGARLVQVGQRYNVSLTAMRSHNPDVPMQLEKACTLRVPAKALDPAMAAPNPLVREGVRQELVAIND